MITKDDIFYTKMRYGICCGYDYGEYRFRMLPNKLCSIHHKNETITLGKVRDTKEFALSINAWINLKESSHEQ